MPRTYTVEQGHRLAAGAQAGDRQARDLLVRLVSVALSLPGRRAYAARRRGRLCAEPIRLRGSRAG
jgi:hypothetical protein